MSGAHGGGSCLGVDRSYAVAGVDLSHDVVEFIDNRIDSVMQLEVLLLLRAHANESHDANDITPALPNTSDLRNRSPRRRRL